MSKSKKQLFMGNGERSSARCYELIHMLNEAFGLLVEIQQAPRPTDPREAHERYAIEVTDNERKVEDIAVEIYEALTGENPRLAAKRSKHNPSAALESTNRVQRTRIRYLENQLIQIRDKTNGIARRCEDILDEEEVEEEDEKNPDADYRPE